MYALSVLGYSAKLKGVWNVWCTFSALFFHKNVPYLILYQWTKFQCRILFLSQDIKQNVLLSSYLDKDDIINFKTFLESTSKSVAGREKNENLIKNSTQTLKRNLTKLVCVQKKNLFYMIYFRIQRKHQRSSKRASYIGSTTWPDSPKLMEI